MGNREIPDLDMLFELADLFKVFGDSTRLRIMYAISDEELSVLSIAETLGMEQSTISHQLRVLRNNKLVRARREGKQIYYTLDDDHVKKIIAIAETDGYEKVSFNFATKELRFESEKKHPAAEIQQICDSIEDGVSVKETASKEKKKLTTEHILLIIALVFGAAAVVFHLAVHNEAADIAVLVLSLAATVLAGWKVFIKGFKNLIKFRIEETVLMSIAVIAAFILGEYVEGAMVTLLFTVGELIEDFAVDASRRDIEKLSQIRPDTAIIIHHGHEEEVAAESVAVGEIIVIKPHARIPIDGVVVEGSSTVDNAALTGESIPVAVAVDDEVLSGGINGDSLLKIRTTKAFGEALPRGFYRWSRTRLLRRAKAKN